MKDVFNLLLVREIAAELLCAHAPFDVNAFVGRATDGLDQLELTALKLRTLTMQPGEKAVLSATVSLAP